jgi:hypothetical protein
MSMKYRCELIDCGRVSARTRGLSFQLLFEPVNPLFGRIFIAWP